MTLLEWRQNIEKALSESNISNAQLEAKWLLSNALERESSFIVLNPDYVPTAEENATIERWLKRRLEDEPLSRIRGEREFWSLSFFINEHTLDPRPETEILVEQTLKWIGNNREKQWKILDLGTGTGCILICLLYELKHAKGVGVDINRDALDMARKNAIRHNVASRIHFIENDWINHLAGKFDIIVSNPPYIPNSDAERLEKGVRNYDPPQALFGGEDGLDFYRRLANGGRKVMAPNGILILEFGQGQRKAIEELFHDAGFKTLFIARDLTGIERVIGFSV